MLELSEPKWYEKLWYKITSIFEYIFEFMESLKVSYKYFKLIREDKINEYDCESAFVSFIYTLKPIIEKTLKFIDIKGTCEMHGDEDITNDIVRLNKLINIYIKFYLDKNIKDIYDIELDEFSKIYRGRNDKKRFEDAITKEKLRLKESLEKEILDLFNKTKKYIGV